MPDWSERIFHRKWTQEWLTINAEFFWQHKNITSDRTSLTGFLPKYPGVFCCLLQTNQIAKECLALGCEQNQRAMAPLWSTNSLVHVKFSIWNTGAFEMLQQLRWRIFSSILPQVAVVRTHLCFLSTLK